MPFLRRRGNMASETDIRRHSVFETSRQSHDNDQNRPSSPPKPEMPLIEDSNPLSQELSHASECPDGSSGPTRSPAEGSSKFRRFSLLRYRNASDPQLSLRAKQQAEKPPPIPRPPAIITTAPTNDVVGPKKKTSRRSLAVKFRRSNDMTRDGDIHHSTGTVNHASDECVGQPLATIGEPEISGPAMLSNVTSNGHTLSNANNRKSESSRSETSSAEHGARVSPATTPKKTERNAPFFRLRRTKVPEPLFPLSHLPQKKDVTGDNSSAASLGVLGTPRPASSQSATTMSRLRSDAGEENQLPQPSAASALFVRSGGRRSGQSSPTRTNLLRGRSSTMSSVGRDSTDEHLLPPTSRTSTSTGRKSFGDLFGLNRIRQNSDISRQGTLTPATPGSLTSKNNSLQLPRESIALPERQEDESPAKYLARIEGVISRGVIASALSKGTDAFSAAVLRSYMRSFSFFGDPMDMAIRKLLMEAELPKETQQIDRCLQAFANRYHECNPGIYSSPDQAYFIAFSLLILHTDVFNKNNKHKMQKSDYLKNTRGEGIIDDILECFYDNISYTPFIHVEDDLELTTERTATLAIKSKKKQLLPGGATDPAKRAAKEPIDPYTLLLDGNLDALRPNLKDAMHLDDHFNYLGPSSSLNLKDLQKTFFKTGVLQIVSARSRPDAFMSEKTATNPADAHPGIVDIKVTKVGLLWRKDAKKRKTRSPWQEWGAILTGAQLYFFRNTSWVKNLMHQHDNHLKNGHDGIPVIFKPPLEEFKPDSLMSTHAAVALIDSTYKKHKNAFVYVRQGGLDEVLLADTEEERNDWLAKLNYAAAFRTSGVRMRGVVGANYDGQGRRGIRRLDSSDATQLVQTPTGPVAIARGQIDQKMAEDIQTARRDGMLQKIDEADRKVEESHKTLDEQLRNARHLQILAPIQPRTREQLLLAAARLSAKLKWTRMEIWREMCHRDILNQDLEDDRAPPSSPAMQPEGDAASTPRPLVSRIESRSKRHAATEQSSHDLADSGVLRLSSTTGTSWDTTSPSKTRPQTPPHAVSRPQQGSQGTTQSRSDGASTRRGSGSSVAASGTLSLTSTPHAKPPRGDDMRTSRPTEGSIQEDVDADERDFLKQAGLWEGRSKTSLDKIREPASNESAEYPAPAERDKLERSKIRRSLQRTLRESAGHLSHHRSRRGREISTTGAVPLDDASRDTMLSRGTGSFVVHGKKASVINLGTELQTLSQDEKILSRIQQQSQHSEQIASSPLLGSEPYDGFHSAPETTSESNGSTSRRDSAASASTATARSFRELHRKYSSAQTARSTSTGAGRPITSDGDSDVAEDIAEWQISPHLPADDDQDSGPSASTEYCLDGSVDTAGEGSDDSQDSDDQCDDAHTPHQRLPKQSTQAIRA